MKLKVALALSTLVMSAAANAQLSGVQVNGSLNFGGGGTNYFNPANGFVPAGYGNTGGLPVTIGAGTEFGFADGANTDTANFTDTQLIITDVSVAGGLSSTYTFTSLTPGAFIGLSLIGSNFPTPFTYDLTGDTLTIAFSPFSTGGTFTSTFDLSMPSVPEPATWAMMLLGFGGIGWQMRRQRKTMSVQAA